MHKESIRTTISVGMTTYNSATFLKEQLESIFSQSMKPNEIVICDDASTDKTVEIIKSFQKRHTEIPIRLYENPKNIGYMKNFEKAFELCQGDIIVSCDADDVWLPDKVMKIAEAFSESDVVYVFHEIAVTDARLNIKQPCYYKGSRIVNEHRNPEKVILRDIQRKGIPNGMAMAFRKELFEKIRPFYIEHDGWIDICAPLYGRISYIPDTLTLYRRHNSNLSGRKKGLIKSALCHTKRERFHMSPVLLEAYKVYQNRFYNRLSKRVIDELNERISFEESLLRVMSERRFRACIIMIGTYKKGYDKYRGNWKLLIADLINILTHNE